MSDILRNLVEAEFDQQKNQHQGQHSRKQLKASKAPSELAKEGRCRKELARDRKERVRKAVEAIAAGDQRGAKVKKDAAKVIREHVAKQKRWREGEKNQSQGRKEKATVFTDEDFEKWSKAYFVNSKLE